MMKFLKSIPSIIFKGIRCLAYGVGCVIGFVYYFFVGMKEEYQRKGTTTVTNDESSNA